MEGNERKGDYNWNARDTQTMSCHGCLGVYLPSTYLGLNLMCKYSYPSIPKSIDLSVMVTMS